MNRKQLEQFYYTIAKSSNGYYGFINIFRRDDRHRVWLDMAGLIETSQIKKND